ncbi:MAG: nuclear transport factor 2 family protein [Actinomycetota bacterium]|nr:nuclear transport factor 2 family protein [Actinomycetota bacterium]
MDSPGSIAVDAFLSAVERGDIGSCSAWSPDAVLDATVPNWRFRLIGPTAIRAEYGHWFADPGHFAELRRVSIAGGELVEYLLEWTENGVQHSAHHMHVLEVRDGLIETDTVICGGRWPASLLAEMNAAQQARDESTDA